MICGAVNRAYVTICTNHLQRRSFMANLIYTSAMCAIMKLSF